MRSVVHAHGLRCSPPRALCQGFQLRGLRRGLRCPQLRRHAGRGAFLRQTAVCLLRGRRPSPKLQVEALTCSYLPFVLPLAAHRRPGRAHQQNAPVRPAGQPRGRRHRRHAYAGAPRAGDNVAGAGRRRFASSPSARSSEASAALFPGLARMTRTARRAAQPLDTLLLHTLITFASPLDSRRVAAVAAQRPARQTGAAKCRSCIRKRGLPPQRLWRGIVLRKSGERVARSLEDLLKSV